MRCPRHVAWKQVAQNSSPHRSPQQILGDVVHRALKEVVAAHERGGVDERQSFTSLWSDALAAELGRSHDTAAGSPETWPDYQMKRLRAERLAQRVVALLDAHTGGIAIPEAELWSVDRRLHGFADLVVRAPGFHAVYDYKTGVVFESDGSLRTAYRDQLLFYAAMEHATTGSWPTHVAVLPLEGPELVVPYDEDTAEGLLTAAMISLDAYNQSVPSAQLARPQLAACMWCRFAIRCEDFWAATANRTFERVLGLVGVLVTTYESAQSGMTAILRDEDGTEIVVRGMPIDLDLRKVGEGHVVRVTGMRRSEATGEWWLGQYGQYEVA
jgi:PD-(D/E)XK nuclease superfamily